MSRSLVFSPSCLAILVLIALCSGCSTSAPPGNNGSVLPMSPTVTAGTGTSSCGFTTCHGLDLACGTNPPQVCTMEYALGDKCRQYAYCSGAGGSCRLVTTAAYDQCKACIQKCGGADTTEIFICEEKC
jgi:hypothetical protein